MSCFYSGLAGATAGTCSLPLIVGGDFNCGIGQDDALRGVVGPNTVEKMTGNGERLVEFLYDRC